MSYGHHIATMKVFLFLVSALLVSSACFAQMPTPQRAPVLVELFTSEGCSDCPPADALLATLDQTQPVPGAQIIVLSEHVDYWNRLGWTDPYSSALFSRRQESYSDRFGLRGVYTPQMVVDGTSEFVGSDGKEAQSAIKRLCSARKINVAISDVKRSGDDLLFTLDAPSLSSGHGDAYMALALKSASSNVRAGENSGRKLDHVSVVRVLVPVAELGKDPVHKTVQVHLGSLAQQRDLKLIVFAQERNAGRVLGATEQDLTGF